MAITLVAIVTNPFRFERAGPTQFRQRRRRVGPLPTFELLVAQGEHVKVEIGDFEPITVHRHGLGVDAKSDVGDGEIAAFERLAREDTTYLLHHP